MKRRSQIWAVMVLVLGVTGVACWFAMMPTEPSYHGKTASQWFREIPGDRVIDAKNNSVDAILNIDSEEAVPFLMHEMGSSISKSQKLIDCLKRICHQKIDTEVRSSKASYLLTLLGPRAKSAVPELCELARRDSAVQVRAIRLLGEIHSQPELCVPMLGTIVRHDQRRAVSIEAAASLSRFGSDAKPALPSLILKWRSGSAGDDYHEILGLTILEIDPDVAEKEGLKRR
jgi:hypothetical protein